MYLKHHFLCKDNQYFKELKMVGDESEEQDIFLLGDHIDIYCLSDYLHGLKVISRDRNNQNTVEILIEGLYLDQILLYLIER